MNEESNHNMNDSQLFNSLWGFLQLLAMAGLMGIALLEECKDFFDWNIDPTWYVPLVICFALMFLAAFFFTFYMIFSLWNIIVEALNRPCYSPPVDEDVENERDETQHQNEQNPLSRLSSEQILQKIHKPIRSMLLNRDDAQVVIYCLLLDKELTIRNRQIALLKKHESQSVLDEVRKHRIIIASLDHEIQRSLQELATPALSELDRAEYQKFRELVNQLIQAGGKGTRSSLVSLSG